MKVTTKKFGELDNQVIHSYTLTNINGMSVSCIDYGCIITDIYTPDRSGNLENVVLGFDTIDEYINHSPYFGAIVGRIAGRIKGGQFKLDGQTYQLERNENNNHIHGGTKGFSDVVWDATTIEKYDAVGVEFRYQSKDGDGGYPGNVDMKVTYLLTNNNEVVLTAHGVSDQDTILNLTNHTYFNLSGNSKRDILDHELTLKSDRFVPLNNESLPTGEILAVTGTPFDFKNGRKIVDGTTTDYPQNVLVGHGYDHPFLLSNNKDREIQLKDQESGRTLTVETNQPAVVIYTSNHLKGDYEIRGVKARPHLAICLETQGVPDSIHHPEFPSIVLEKGKEYYWETKYAFGVN
ncbi:aldose epimerase family protein [Fredinandcohnia sp. 179-A 10B2 NHS]|uniref:aldose epimerase family protein n=1 Tax=Fredinandcohnia sp. 179-A 10B2 NHS TaxID=3235176 RepID=UPI00399FCE95